MKGRTFEGIALVAMLVVAGAVSWWLLLRPPPETDPTRLDALPARFEGWQAFDIAIDESVAEMLAADHHVQRAYRHDQGYVVFVYVGYYGTRRGGTPEHTPDVCYPAQGWAILESHERRVGGRDGFDLREFLVEQEGERRLVHFWYRTDHASGLTSTTDLRLHHFWSRLTRNRGDGALVRLSTIIRGEEVDAARARLLGLEVAVEDALDRVWPERAAVQLAEAGARP